MTSDSCILSIHETEYKNHTARKPLLTNRRRTHKQRTSNKLVYLSIKKKKLCFVYIDIGKVKAK